MPVLKNARHEAFAQALAKGSTATEAYEIAGYTADRKNAHRLTTKDDIAARVKRRCSAGCSTSSFQLASCRTSRRRLKKFRVTLIRGFRLSRLSPSPNRTRLCRFPRWLPAPLPHPRFLPGNSRSQTRRRGTCAIAGFSELLAALFSVVRCLARSAAFLAAISARPSRTLAITPPRLSASIRTGSMTGATGV